MKRIIAVLLALLISAPVFSQAQKQYDQAQLDRMLAPIALYPDPLLSQILMASTYPIEVVEAARWTRANAGLRGDDAVRAVEREDWDPSVKSLVAFPQILQRMDENLEWTRSLGDAFLAQQPHVMDTVQQLRQRAHAAGNLQSSEHQRIQQQGQLIYIQPASPQVVYVPYYDPLAVYGPWWWPAYRPVVWAPWPGYVRPRPGVWRHDPHHRRGVEYRDASVRRQFAASPQAQPQLQAVQAQPQARPQQRDEERAKERAQRREEHRNPQGRDLQDSKVLTPAPRTEARPQGQVQPRPQPQVQERPRHVHQEERRHAREERREQRQEQRRENHQNREHSKGRDRS